MTDRATAWSVTINNPTASDEEGIALARQRGWRVEGQKEKGKEGTEHYQLLVKTPQVRFSAVKRAFPRAHIEVARNVQALKTYVHKEDTRQSELPTSQDKYPSLSKFWDLIYTRIIANIGSVMEDPAELRVSDAHAIDLFDNAVRSLIADGYYVESLAVNPQVRSSWKLYRNAIFFRSWTACMSQPDRQTDTRLESEVDIPTIEHTNARDDYSQGEDYRPRISPEGRDCEDLEDCSSSSNGGYTESSDSCFSQEDD